MSPMGRNLSSYSESPVRGQGSPRRRSPSRRERSPVRHRSSHKANSPPREKLSSRARSPKPSKLRSSVSRSPSPRTKRLRRAQAEKGPEKLIEREYERNHTRGSEKLREMEHEKTHTRGSEKLIEREHERNHTRGSDMPTRKERGSEREVPSERRERRSERDAVDAGYSRSRHGQSTSPLDRHHKSRHRSRSTSPDANKTEVTNSRGGEHRNGDNDSVAKMKAAEESLEAKEKQKPSFELSGKLAAETNRVRGVTLLFNEPPDARKPDIRWRLYVFKGGEVLNEPLYVHRQSSYLFGRERRVSDIPTDHPSCSKQHAVLQYR
ncbi:hypothetical protein U1Q18_000494 [Sarracenia purpurea var. burkii]